VIIYERDFDAEDPQNQGYSLREVDYYAWIPAHFRKAIKDHRLSLRKNLRTGKFELYRKYYMDGREEVIFQDDLEHCLEAAHAEATFFHGPRERDQIGKEADR